MSTTQTIGNIYERIKKIRTAVCILYVRCVFLNLTKTFDIVNHAKLLHKMEHNFGVCKIPLQLCKSYLSDRHYYTKTSRFTRR